MSDQEKQSRLELTSEEMLGLVHGDFLDDGNATPPNEPGVRAKTEVHGDDPPRWAASRDLLVATLQDFALRWSACLSRRLRTDTGIDIQSLDELTYGKFIFSLSNPTCVQVVESQELADPFVIEFPPGVVFPLMERLLGGNNEPPGVVRRPLTKLEQRLAASISLEMLEELARAWSHAVPFTTTIRQTESNPKVVRAVHPGDAMVVLDFAVNFQSIKDRVRLALTQRTVDQIVDRLAGANQHPSTSISSSQLVVSLAETSIEWEDLLELRVGDILTTETAAESPATMSVNGKPAFRVTPGTNGNRKAVRLMSHA